MPKLIRRVAVVAAASMLAAAAMAAQPTAKPAAKAASSAEGVLKANLTQLFELKTGMKADAVTKAPLPGFYEIVVGTTIYYMEPTGKWLFDGHLVDLNTKSSVTAARKIELEKADKPVLDWRTLNLADAIKVQRGQQVKGRVLVVFEDPNCRFCKMLHPVLESMPNLVTYTFPVAFLGPNSQAKNEALWCSKDRAAAWAAVMKDAPVQPEAGCDTSALARNGDLARALKVTGTPTMFLADGTRLPGFMDAAALERELSKVERELTAKAR